MEGTGTVMSKGWGSIDDSIIIDREDGLIDGDPGFIEQDFGV